MDLSLVYHRIIDIAKIVVDEPLVYLPLIGAWLITELYFIIHSDEAHGHTNVMSTGITLVFTAYMLSPFAQDVDEGTYFGLRNLALVLMLFLYGLFLINAGIRRSFRPWIAEFFGAPGHSLVPGLMGILYIEHRIPFDETTLIIIASPVVFLGIIKSFRRTLHRFRRRKEEKVMRCILSQEKCNADDTEAPIEPAKKEPSKARLPLWLRRLLLS
ncbi:hypothetical protein P4C99_15880 [Pontiellaceae bacterium B1224]|nr:hypothetical protein [Pontiellaceae bacterium B1224]